MSLMEAHPLALGFALIGLAYVNGRLSTPRGPDRPDRGGGGSARVARHRRAG